MKPTKTELTKLHFINSLFADLTGNDLYLAEQVKAAIETSIEDGPPQIHDETFNEAAILLLQKQFRGRPGHGFSHWNSSANAHGFTPLWARQELIGIFKKLAPYSHSTVLVTDLRSSICPPGKRWTSRLRDDYGEAIGLIQELAGAWTTRRANVTLLFF